MFWDGTRWIDERSAPPPASKTPRIRKARTFSLRLPLLVLIPALLWPLVGAEAASRPKPSHWRWGATATATKGPSSTPRPSLLATPEPQPLLAVGIAPVTAGATTDPTTGPSATNPTAPFGAGDPTIVPPPPTTGPPSPTADPTAAPTAAPTTAPTKAPTPAPTAAPTTPPVTACGTTLQARIDATSSGGTVNLTGCSYSGTATISKAMTVVGGTLSVPSGKTGVTIKAANVTINGLTLAGSNTAYAAIWATSASNLTVTKVHINGFVYAGVMTISVVGGSITNSSITNIGINYVSSMNAYGIALSDGGGVPSSGITVSGNTIDNVPTWHGIDTHGGRHLTIVNNDIHRTNRAIFITDSANGGAQDITISGNSMDKPTRRPDVLNNYPYNEVGLTVIAGCLRVSGNGNVFDGWPSGNHLDTNGGPNTFTGSVIRNPS